MSFYPGDGRVLPAPRQELLLKAALLRGEASMQAWREWSAEGIDHVDWGSYRMLPQLYRNLRAQGAEHPLMPKLRGIYRHAWCENQLRFRDAELLLRTFHEAGIPAMVLKGAALSLLHYKDFGARLMQDVDILVPEDRLRQALDLLGRQHWTAYTWTPARFTEGFKRYRHAVAFVSGSDRQLDLHWHVLYLACSPGYDRTFWEGSVPLDFRGAPARALNPADQLLHICLHGAAGADGGGALRTVADSVTVLGSCGTLDWGRVLALADELRVALPLREILRYLKAEFAAPVPDGLLESLDAMPVSRTERLFFERLRSPGLQRPLDTLRVLFHQHSRSFRGSPFLVRLAAFPRFLQYYWGLSSPWRMLPQAVEWLRQRLRPHRSAM